MAERLSKEMVCVDTVNLLLCGPSILIIIQCLGKGEFSFCLSYEGTPSFKDQDSKTKITSALFPIAVSINQTDNFLVEACQPNIIFYNFCFPFLCCRCLCNSCTHAHGLTIDCQIPIPHSGDTSILCRELEVMTVGFRFLSPVHLQGFSRYKVTFPQTGTYYTCRAIGIISSGNCTKL